MIHELNAIQLTNYFYTSCSEEILIALQREVARAFVDQLFVSRIIAKRSKALLTECTYEYIGKLSSQ